MSEEWRDIPGYEGRYQASSQGRIRNAQTGHVLKLQTGQDQRYLAIRLGHNGKKHLVHRLVAAAFHGGPEEGQQANHLNGKPWDNRPENLEWVTPSGNSKHAFEAGLVTKGAPVVRKRRILMMSEDQRVQIGFRSLAEAERELGINRSTIHEALNKPGHTAGGWHWAYY